MGTNKEWTRDQSSKNLIHLNTWKRDHVRASAGSGRADAQASKSASNSTVTPAAFALSVAATRDHQRDGMTPLLHHFDTASAPGSAPSKVSASANAFRVGQSSTTARNVAGRSSIESDIGQSGLQIKANVADDYQDGENHNACMAGKRNETEEVRLFMARVKAAREERYTQKQIAGILDIAQDTYKHYENRSPLPHRFIPKFVLATGVKYEWLLAADGTGPAVEPLPEPKPRKQKAKPKRKVA